MLYGALLPLRAEESLPENEHDCFIVPTTVTDVGSSVRGVVTRLLVDRGDTVTQGQPIVELDSGTEQILVTHAQARADMKSELVARQADLELAELELARIEDMHKRAMAPTQQRDEINLRKRIAQAGLVQALENQKLAQIELQRALHELEQRTLLSPVDGVVVEQLILPGEFVYDAPVTTIATLHPLRVEVVLPAKLFGSIVPGVAAFIEPELARDKPLDAVVEVVDALLDTRSGTFGVRLTLPNHELSITAGQKCTVDFLSGSAAVELAEETD